MLNGQVFYKLADLKPLIKKLRGQGKKIVLTQGSFDLIHIGHGRYLEHAKSLGAVLIVGTDSDEKIKFRKGKNRPVVPEDERLEMLTYLKAVDYVVLKQLKAPQWSLIKLVKPDVLVSTRHTYTAEQLTQLKKYCREIVVMDPMATTSTSAKLRRVQLGAAKQIGATLSKRLVKAIEEVLEEVKNGRH